MEALEPDLATPRLATNPRRARIFEAACRCFANQGFQSTTIIDVAEAAGVSRPLVYKYFGDKDGLIDSVLDATFADWAALHHAFAQSEDDAPPNVAADLERRFEVAIDFVRERPMFRTILQQDPQIVVRGHLEGLRQCRKVSADATRTILRSGIAAGTLRSDLDEDTVTTSLEMILFSLLERALGIRPEIGLEPELVSTTLSVLIDGLRVSEDQGARS